MRAHQLKDQTAYVWRIIMRTFWWTLSVGLLGERAPVLERAEVRAVAARRKVLLDEAARMESRLRAVGAEPEVDDDFTTLSTHLQEVTGKMEAVRRRNGPSAA